MGALRGTLGQFGALWDTMGTLCEPMGTSGGTFGHNGIPVIQWGHFGMVWGTFGGTLGAKWDNLGHFGVLWDTFGPESGDTSGALRDTAGTLWDPVVPPGAPLRGCGGGASRGRTALHRPTPPHRSHRPYCAPPVRSSRFGGGVGGIGFRIGAGRGPLPPPHAHWGHCGVMGRDRLWGRKSALGGSGGDGAEWYSSVGLGGRGRREKVRKKGKMEGKRWGGIGGKRERRGKKGWGTVGVVGPGRVGPPPALLTVQRSQPRCGSGPDPIPGPDPHRSGCTQVGAGPH